MTKYEDAVERGRERHGVAFHDTALAPEFVPYFNSGERVRVRFHYGETLTGTIGMTTGWRPCFLLMRSSRSTGSPWTLNDDDKVIAVKRGRKYVEVR